MLTRHLILCSIICLLTWSGITQSYAQTESTCAVDELSTYADLPAGSDPVTLALSEGLTLIPERDDALETLPTGMFTSAQAVTFHQFPDAEAPGAGQLPAGQTITVYGQTPSGAWYRSALGWLPAESGTLAAGADALIVIDEIIDAYPMRNQAFKLIVEDYLACEDQPPTLTITTPADAPANLMINGVEIRAIGTLRITIAPDNSHLTIMRETADGLLVWEDNIVTLDAETAAVVVRLDELGDAPRRSRLESVYGGDAGRRTLEPVFHYLLIGPVAEDQPNRVFFQWEISNAPNGVEYVIDGGKAWETAPAQTFYLEVEVVDTVRDITLRVLHNDTYIYQTVQFGIPVTGVILHDFQQ